MYYKLEEATRGTSYVDSIKPFQRNRDGRGAYLSLLHQYCGEDKWDTELKRVNLTLQTLKWKGQSNYPLERFCQKHRNGYTTMRAAAEHVDFQLPNQHTRVGYLLDAIECDDAKLQAAIANIENDKSGKRVDFEAAVAFLLPSCPISRKRQKTTKTNVVGVSEISATTGGNSSFGSKSGIGETGVHFRYYQPAEFKKLTPEQIAELKQWRSSSEGKATIAKNKTEYTRKKRKNGGKESGNSRKRSKKGADISSAVEKEIARRIAESEEKEKRVAKDHEEFRNYIMSVVQDAGKPKKKASFTAESSTTDAGLPTLSTTLKRILGQK